MPYILEYGREYPWAYGLVLVPLYVGAARVKNQAHWQSDVLVGWTAGGLAGWYAHSRETPLLVEILPHGVVVGLKTRFSRALAPAARPRFASARQTRRDEPHHHHRRVFRRGHKAGRFFSFRSGQVNTMQLSHLCSRVRCEGADILRRRAVACKPLRSRRFASLSQRAFCPRPT